MHPIFLAASATENSGIPSTPLWAWAIFAILVLGMVTADLIAFSRRSAARGMREAAVWMAIWIGLALGFNVAVYFWKGPTVAEEFLTAYLVEESLSVDNIFVFLVIFRYFKVPGVYQHRVLFWGILGAIVLRGIMIGLGVQLIKHFSFLMYLFALILVVSGIKLLFSREGSHDPSKGWAFRLTKRLVPMTDKLSEEKFFVVEQGRRLATPLFLVLVVVETTDMVFAFDSIPACLGISNDPFVIYTSNIFAILGLRAMYFLLAGAMSELRFLKPALCLILVFIGAKMTMAELHHDQVDWAFQISTRISLGVVGGILCLAIAGSLLFPHPALNRQEPKPECQGEPGTGDRVTPDRVTELPSDQVTK